jgi:DNA-binding transcriptional regulator YhcF (GntR family)
MLIRIDPSRDEPLHEQIAAQIRRAIGDGRVAHGEQLPPARDLATALDVNMHTVLRAYASLRDEGLVEMRRGRGVTVASTGGNRARVIELARAFLLEARRQSMGLREIKRLLEELS